MVALQAQVISFPPVPPALARHAAFTRNVEAVARRKGARVNDKFKQCGDARAYSNKYSVEAFGTPRFSAEWKKAADAMSNALTVCRGLRRALRDQEDFLVGIAQAGNKHDGDLAADQVIGVSSELGATEQFFATETLRYRKLLTEGWGDPHCLERPDGYMPASSLCPKGMATSHP